MRDARDGSEPARLSVVRFDRLDQVEAAVIEVILVSAAVALVVSTIVALVIRYWVNKRRFKNDVRR